MDALLKKMMPTRTRRRVTGYLGVTICTAIGLGIIAEGNGMAQQRYIAPSKREVRVNRLIERLEQGYVVMSGIDYMWVDQEHAALDFHNLRTRIATLQQVRNEKGQVAIPPLVRIPTEGDQEVRWIIKQTLEAGAMGIIVPHVATKEQAIKIVQAIRYPQRPDSKYPFPNGVRGHGCGVNCGPLTWGLRMDEYVRLADPWPLNPDGELFVMLMIESREAVDNIDELLDVPGVSAWFIGPSDLSMQMTGRPFRAWHWPNNQQPPEVEAAISKVIAACRAKNKICGMHTQTGLGGDTVEARLQYLIREGWRVILGAPMPRPACTQKSPAC